MFIPKAQTFQLFVVQISVLWVNYCIGTETPGSTAKCVVAIAAVWCVRFRITVPSDSFFDIILKISQSLQSPNGFRPMLYQTVFNGFFQRTFDFARIKALFNISRERVDVCLCPHACEKESLKLSRQILDFFVTL